MLKSTKYKDFTVKVFGKTVTTTVTVYGINENGQWLIEDVEYDVPHECDRGDVLDNDERAIVADMLEEKIEDTVWGFDDYAEEDETDYPEYEDAI